MKIIITADLHYNVKRSRDPARHMVERMKRARPDVIALVGDTAGHDLSVLNECLGLFADYHGHKLFVVGNHELWSHTGDSWERYERHLPEAARQAGFHYLDESPLIVNDIAFVGSVGWYDYSFRYEDLGIPMRFYKAKVGPGAAERLAECRHLLADNDDVPEEARRIGARWMDGPNVTLPFSDPEFTDLLAKRLDDHLAGLPDQVSEVVALIHHLPFADLVRRRGDPSWDFAAAFLGSPRFGEVLLRHPRVAHAYCGHSHQRAHMRKGGLECVNVGSTYRDKRFEVLEL